MPAAEASLGHSGFLAVELWLQGFQVQVSGCVHGFQGSVILTVYLCGFQGRGCCDRGTYTPFKTTTEGSHDPIGEALPAVIECK